MADAQHSTKSTTLPVFDSYVKYTPAYINDTIAERAASDIQHCTKSTTLPVSNSYVMCTPAEVNDNIIVANPMSHYQLQCKVYDPSYYFPDALLGHYRYTQDLLHLNKCIPNPDEPPTPQCLTRITTPLKPAKWELELKHMPDRQLVDYLLSGMTFGFRIGFERKVATSKATNNMQSAQSNPEPVHKFLLGELQSRRIIGPLDPALFPNIHVSRFGVIPKRSQPGKWRLILDLSHPVGHSVNDGIDSAYCSMTYASVDNAAAIIAKLGTNTLLAKIDIAHAYRNIPVHPDDRGLLGMTWGDQLFVDTVLPFGLRSAPKIFCAVADTLEWILRNRGVTHILHYLDDFLTVGAPNTNECLDNLNKLTAVCDDLGLPLAIDKVEGPLTKLVFLGITLDTTDMTMKLPPMKLAELKQLALHWLHRQVSTKRELLSLIGHLAFASKVVPPGRSFVRRMIDLSTTRKHLNDFVRLNEGFKSDLVWWHLFLDTWNGISCLDSHVKREPDFTVFTDASGQWGCGAVQTPFWFQYAWPKSWDNLAIAIKELLPIVMAVALWGRRWSKSHVLVMCDNMSVVCILRSKTSKDPSIMHLVRALHFFLAHWDIRLWADHVPGKVNTAADALSRNMMQVFHKQLPSAFQEGTPLPQVLLDLLVLQRPDWTSTSWRDKFKHFLTIV